MVRLKGFVLIVYVKNVLIFQFQMVRLKVISSPFRKRSSSVFQFQMVRLKVTGLQSDNGFLVISIPDGSIKSDFIEVDFTLKILFQFQMVRLKVSSVAVKALSKFISIPDGSIKRQAAAHPAQGLANFNSRWFD